MFLEIVKHSFVFNLIADDSHGHRKCVITLKYNIKNI